MSIEAVRWAFDQRGLKPAAKLVLVFLADCHNRHSKRCDPSQALLASECEMSRASVNVHLKALEDDGFIRRIQRSNAKTKKQKSTLYVLGCDDEKPQDDVKAVSRIRTREQAKAVSRKRAIPCPENGGSRVQTSRHEPEKNRKRTACATKTAPFFTADERSEAGQIADHIRGGGRINAGAVGQRVRACIADGALLTDDEINKHGLRVAEI
ncbi:helix-turn-helix domain-containing protein [Yoonia sp. I 8.24]|uniref:helix-turn-helix domain-containing protein n=1 Tax=Yoonia sp. I 8.24 TaxID=1537229 RepID=UPI001F94F25E|nr:helix-turn-helix domain-containing protein [Yoonia sp. I 8.24]MCG3267765.1 helix-turn-helix domain-containing protein [Yoonia sp. I 8.24]